MPKHHSLVMLRRVISTRKLLRIDKSITINYSKTRDGDSLTSIMLYLDVLKPNVVDKKLFYSK